jgi:hypothetical protein
MNTLIPHLEACRRRHGDTPVDHLINTIIPTGGAPLMPAELDDDPEGRIDFAVARWDLEQSGEHAGRRIIRVDPPCWTPPSLVGFRNRWEIESVPA